MAWTNFFNKDLVENMSWIFSKKLESILDIFMVPKKWPSSKWIWVWNELKDDEPKEIAKRPTQWTIRAICCSTFGVII